MRAECNTCLCNLSNAPVSSKMMSHYGIMRDMLIVLDKAGLADNTEPIMHVGALLVRAVSKRGG